MNNIIKENTELVCQSIKLSIRIMSKLIKFISENSKINEMENIKTFNNRCKSTENLNNTIENLTLNSNFTSDLLMKTKLFLKITTLIKENAKSTAEEKIGKAKEFFIMYEILFTILKL